MRDITFICGPFRGYTPWETEKNIRVAEECAALAWEQGFIPICPHTNSRFFDKLLHDDTFLNGYLEILDRCNSVILLPGWQYSAGSKVELKHAVERKMHLFIYWPKTEAIHATSRQVCERYYPELAKL
jgi:hypothetical protein